MNAAEQLRPDADRIAAQREVRRLRSRITRLDADSIDLILTGARTHHRWTDRPVAQTLLRQLYDIVKMGSTSMNGCPARFVFVTSDDGKARIAPSLKPANVAKVMDAPVTVIIAYDTEFWTHLLTLFPHEDRRGHFRGKPDHAEVTAFRNSTIQGATMMIAARALGLDIGALSGFDNAVLDVEFFAGSTLKSNFLLNLGYADESALFGRLPRFDFEDVCRFE